jgi:anaerobic carbon-monoxide dehydrogenase iron sulfur subunit
MLRALKLEPEKCTGYLQCEMACAYENEDVLNPATGAKYVIEDLCAGSKICTIACPLGTVYYNQASGKVIKRDLCGGDPWCAQACPTGAITYVDIDQTGHDRMRSWPARSASEQRAQT